MRDIGIALIVCGVLAGFGALLVFLPSDKQSGEPVTTDPRSTGGVGLTTYCLPDSRLRVFERPFPMGGTQPLFSVVEVAHEPPGSPYRC